MRRAAVRVVAVVLTLAAGVPAASSGAVAGTPIDGTWTWTWTAAQLRRQGASPYDLRTYTGPATAVFADGRGVARWRATPDAWVL
jgi:hypothetical protein